MQARAQQADSQAAAAISPIERLERFAAGAATEDDLVWIKRASADYLEEMHLKVTFDQCLGLINSKGPAWRAHLKRKQRDALRSIGAMILNSEPLDLVELTDRITARLNSYQARWHRVDKGLYGRVPARYAGRIDELLFTAFEIERKLHPDGDHFPAASPAALRKIVKPLFQ